MTVRTQQLAGREQMRTQYGGMFERKDVHAEIVARVRAGNWVVDHERVTWPGRSMEGPCGLRSHGTAHHPNDHPRLRVLKWRT